ncbi:MAG: SagB/ThcOx family dehydrogenase [Methanosarcinales archaeon]|nr:SagB/ThcOx family dehydrogenase [Methanosarcinales archaeon]
MKIIPVAIALVLMVVVLAVLIQPVRKEPDTRGGTEDIIILPEPRYSGGMPVEEALLGRRSIRNYKDEALTMSEVSQLLWAAQGITNARGFRTAPSAGALYPLEVYVVAGNVEGLPAGVYKYRPQGHELEMVAEGDVRPDLCAAAVNQECVEDGAAVLVFAAVYERTTGKYGERGVRYVHMEVGHAAQNVYLQAVSLGLGTVVVGAFDDEEVERLLQMGDDERALCIMPVGRL